MIISRFYGTPLLLLDNKSIPNLFFIFFYKTSLALLDLLCTLNQNNVSKIN